MKRLVVLLLVMTCAVACRRSPTLVEVEDPSLSWIRNVRVLDVRTGSVSAPRDVRLADTKIQSIVPAGSAPKDVGLDGAGGTLVPGLIDAHIHLGNTADPPWAAGLPDPQLNLQRLLYCGVTTVLETGGDEDDTFDRREEVQAGELLGPRIFTAGPVFTAPKGHPIPLVKNNMPGWISWYVIPRFTREIGDEAAAKREVQPVLQEQPDVIKIVVDSIPEKTPLLTKASAAAIVRTASAAGVRTVAHIGRTQDALTAAEAGIAAWIHGVYKEAIPADKIGVLAKFGIPMVPTLIVFDNYAASVDSEYAFSELENQVADPKMLAAFKQRPDDLKLPEGGLEFLQMLKKERKTGARNMMALHKAGVRMLAGSDAQTGVYHGPGLHKELVMMHAAGLPADEVLRAATIYPAQFLTRTEDPPFGVIAPGKEADLVVLDGNPMEDFSAISKIKAVVVDGRKIKRHRWPGK